MSAGNFSKIARAILLHRLEVPDAIADALEQDESSDEFREAMSGAHAVVAGIAPIPGSGLVREILNDAADGSTWFADMDDAVATKQITRGEALASHKAANEIEKTLGVEIPRS